MQKLLALIVLAVVVSSSNIYACTLAGKPIRFQPEIAYFAAKPSGKTLVSTFTTVNHTIEDWSSAPNFKFIFDTVKIKGEVQIFTAEQLFGNSAVIKLLNSTFKKRGNREVIGVYWATKANCDKYVKNIGFSDKTVFTAKLSPEKEWIKGIPTFHFLPAENGFYYHRYRGYQQNFKSVDDFLVQYKNL